MTKAKASLYVNFYMKPMKMGRKYEDIPFVSMQARNGKKLDPAVRIECPATISHVLRFPEQWYDFALRWNALNEVR